MIGKMQFLGRKYPVMLLEFDQPPALAIGLMMATIYTIAQFSALRGRVDDECDIDRVRMHDLLSLLLMYFVVMFLRSLTILKLNLPYDPDSTELTSAITFGSIILGTFLMARISNTSHLFPHYVDPLLQTPPNTVSRILHIVFYIVIISLIGFEVGSSFRRAKRLQQLGPWAKWFLGLRLVIILFWVLAAYFVPVNGVKRYTNRGYFWAFLAALLFVQPSYPGVLSLGLMLGILLHEVVNYGAPSIYHPYEEIRDNLHQTQYLYICPYARKDLQWMETTEPTLYPPPPRTYVAMVDGYRLEVTLTENGKGTFELTMGFPEGFDGGVVRCDAPALTPSEKMVHDAAEDREERALKAMVPIYKGRVVFKYVRTVSNFRTYMTYWYLEPDEKRNETTTMVHVPSLVFLREGMVTVGKYKVAWDGLDITMKTVQDSLLPSPLWNQVDFS